jgi:putative endonuclease
MHKRDKGNIGEDIACTFLKGKGFTIVDRNYQRKWGELDIIGQKNNITHFFEVKSVTYDFSTNSDAHKPEDNVHSLKIRHIRRMVETYLADKKIMADQEFQFHVLSVYMNEKTRRAKVKWLKNVIL